ncbi:MAG TPA: type IV pilus modification protein PilV [Halomonas sp.]|nr:type IV pilus modification protein PilV [Halomonas sp.]
MTTNRTRQQQGFTLIEALVALAVLSFGLLGVAAMQLKALQSAHAGYQRSVASLAAQDAQERLWEELASDPSTCPDVASFNAEEWQGNWITFLPELNATPVSEHGSDCTFSIDVSWNDSRFKDEALTETFSYTVRLPVSP